MKDGEDRVRRGLQTPMAKFMREHLEKAGCGVSDSFFKADNCRASISGHYLPGQGIIVCTNHLRFQDQVNQVIIHELIHAYDHCRAANLNWSNPAHQACSEIRANNLSGDCHFKREFLRGKITKIKGHGQECVKRRATESVTYNPNCKSASAAKEAVEAVWDECYNDTTPFEKAP
ncbi:Mitochondrial inner membrane protease atp23 [Euphorbia peplus]|nr:Mitochondrial inner membrane protease atp23 [Euphorbia peplus]